MQVQNVKTKAQKAKMKGNEAKKLERIPPLRPEDVQDTPLPEAPRRQLKAKRQYEEPKGQNEASKGQMKNQKAKMKGNEATKG